ncbi:MAG: glycosyltransferase [Lachnospiraceae bacterium]|nr:glycosyltransferase [Lachnospiraceae bacterium]
MNILFYRYGNICEPAIINTFRSLNINVIEETAEITNKKLLTSEKIELINRSIQKVHPVFIFSINFFPAIAEICHIHKILYLCWTVDSPVLELFSKSIQYDTNRIFLFDKAQYERFHPYNPGCIFHLPLASDVDTFDVVTATITEADIARFSCDISFVGSLYNEKNPLRKIVLDDYTNGYIHGTVEAAMEIYGYNFMEEVVTEHLVNSIRSADSSFYTASNLIANPDKYIVAHSYLGLHAAEIERIRTLNKLAEHFSVDLYTRSDTSALNGVRVHDGIATLTEMPKAFHLSKINLNMTIKPIQTGLPLRIFDICGCGGFLMTNYQAELTDYFEIGTDIEAYTSTDELVDKCAYYLSHEEERRQIALNGYQKVKSLHTYQNRLLQMLRIATNS